MPVCVVAVDNPGAMHIIINGWFAGQETAGSGQYLHHLLARLPAQAPHARFTLLLPDSAMDRERAQQRWPGIEMCAIRLPLLPRQLAKLFWEQQIVPAQARRLRADVLWIPYWAAPWRQPCPTVVTIHDLIPQLVPAYRGGALQRAYTWLVGKSAQRAANVITVSQASAAEIVQHLQIPAARVHSIYHGPNVDVDAAPNVASNAALRHSVRTTYRLPDRYFLYLGGFDVRKNVLRLLDGYARYLERGGDRALHLVIAGKLPARDTAFTPDPRSRADALGISDQVHFCGWVDEADKPAIYALATAYIFPSLYEGFGMMVVEAQSAGTPVVTSL